MRKLLANKPSIRPTWLPALAIAIVAVALRVPFRAVYTYHWDDAQFALSVLNFDLHKGQPHAPGFFVYVLLGKLVNLVVGDPYMSLVWISIVAGAALAAVGWLLARSMFGSRSATVTAVILLTSPLTWFHSEVGLTTIVDSALVTGFIFVGWRAIRCRGGIPQVILLSFLLSVIAGVRLQTVPALTPAGIYIISRLPSPRLRNLLIALCALLVFTAVWFVPLVMKTGGLGEYLALVQCKAAFDAPKTVWGGGGLQAITQNTEMIVGSCWVGLLLALPVAGWGWLWNRPPLDAQSENRRAMELLLFWSIPMLVFWSITYMTMPGYVLNFFPALAIICGWLIGDRLRAIKTIRVAIVSIIALINVDLFLFEPPGTERLMMGLPLTSPEIRRHDRELDGCFKLIREKFLPDRTTIYHGVESFWFGFRHFQYHLPEYVDVLLDPAPLNKAKRIWIGYHQETVVLPPNTLPISEYTLCVLPAGLNTNLFERWFDRKAWQPVAGSDGRLLLGKLKDK